MHVSSTFFRPLTTDKAKEVTFGSVIIIIIIVNYMIKPEKIDLEAEKDLFSISWKKKNIWLHTAPCAHCWIAHWALKTVANCGRLFQIIIVIIKEASPWFACKGELYKKYT